MPIRILLVDGHGVLRAGLRALLNAELGFQVVGEAADGQAAVRLAEEPCPDPVRLSVRVAEIVTVRIGRS